MIHIKFITQKENKVSIIFHGFFLPISLWVITLKPLMPFNKVFSLCCSMHTDHIPIWEKNSFLLPRVKKGKWCQLELLANDLGNFAITTSPIWNLFCLYVQRLQSSLRKVIPKKKSQNCGLFPRGGAQPHSMAFGGVFPNFTEAILVDEISTKVKIHPPKVTT